MPWYTDPKATCKVLNKIATRYELSAVQDLRSVLDSAVAAILRKQDHYYEESSHKIHI